MVCCRVTLASLKLTAFCSAANSSTSSQQGALIAFERQHVIGLHGEDFLGDVALAADRVDGDDGALDRQQVEQLGDGDDLVRLVRHLDLAEHQALMRGKGRHHMDRRLGALLPAGAAQRLAVDGDHLLGRAGQRRHPIDEAALELPRTYVLSTARPGSASMRTLSRR